MSVHTTQVEGQTVRLVDTPGFNDCARPDTDVFNELVYWLIAIYERNIRLSGIVFLHRITDVRLQRSVRRALEILKAMCGKDTFRGAVVATTMWDGLSDVDYNKAWNRHEQLGRDVFKEILSNGGYLRALKSAEADAPKIVRHLLEKNMRLTLAIQRELVGEDLPIQETAAGKVMAADLLKALLLRYDSLEERVADEGAGSEHGALRGNCEDVKTAWVERTREDNIALTWSIQTYMSYQDQLQALESRLVDSSKRSEGSSEPSMTATQPKDMQVSDRTIFSATKVDAPGVTSVASYNEALLLEVQDLRHKFSRRKHSVNARQTAAFGVVGTGLAVGQLIAAMACNVM